MKNLFITIISFTLLGFVNAQERNLDTTLIIKNIRFHFKTKYNTNEDSAFILVKSGLTFALSDTIDGGFAQIQFLDFNKDKNTDILLTHNGKNSIATLYLFDPLTNKFKKIENFEKYPEVVQLVSAPNLYYSYHPDGCADKNWVSDLFKIVNFKIVQLGHIDGNGCDFNVKDYPQVIEIYKITDNDEEKEELIKKLPYLKFIPEFSNKWDFIKKYWNKNYKQFE